MRIYDLARELKIANKDLMKALSDIGVSVKSHSSSIDEETVAKVKRLLESRSAPLPAVAPAAQKAPQPPPARKPEERDD